MCGIAGIWGLTNRPALQKMMRAMVHRGPDAEGTFESDAFPGLLGHRRLSIIDVQGGNQPLLGPNANLALVANGEVYNSESLKATLVGDYTFRTRSDSEVVLAMLALHGPRSVSRFDGMFAFALANGDELCLARDPIGIKPLYWADLDGALAFSSELCAFPETATSVQEFPPGTLFSTKAGYSKFRELSGPKELHPGTAGDHVARLRAALEASVVKRLVSDVPVGAFLSGGLDSSAIVALMRPHVDRLHTFTVGLEGSPDIVAARLVARHLGTRHHEYVLRPNEISEHLPTIVTALESYDQDLVRSAVPTYFTARLAAQHVKVVLTGEGSDELFAGYRYHRKIVSADALQKEIVRSLCALHNVNLQRVDRLTMAHSLEGRVPFLDLHLIDTALAIPPRFKLPSYGGQEKWLLRAAVEDLLPAEVVWREKAQFDEGTGSSSLLPALTDKLLGSTNPADYKRRYPEAKLRSAEECYYHQLLLRRCPNVAAVLPNVARWAQRPSYAA